MPSKLDSRAASDHYALLNCPQAIFGKVYISEIALQPSPFRSKTGRPSLSYGHGPPTGASTGRAHRPGTGHQDALEAAKSCLEQTADMDDAAAHRSGSANGHFGWKCAGADIAVELAYNPVHINYRTSQQACGSKCSNQHSMMACRGPA